MNIKNILDEISAENSTNQKQVILSKYKDNKLLFRVIEMACSRRIKFYIKQIPQYSTYNFDIVPLETGLNNLDKLSNRELTGHKASEWLSLTLSHLSAEDAYVIERVISKDLKIGMGTTNINKVIPNTIPKTPYMGAKPYSSDLVDKLFAKGDVVSDIKMDGRYCNAIIRNKDIDLESRQGETTYVGNALFKRQLEGMPDCVLNGELTIQGMDRYTANGVIASIIDIEEKRESRTQKENEKKLTAFEAKHGDYQAVLDRVIYTVWDMILVEEYFAKKSMAPYSKRFATLEELIESLGEITGTPRIQLIERRLVSNKEEAIQHFKEALARGLEGTVLKSLEGGWKDGKPTTKVKMKLEINLDLRIIGFQYGKKGTKNENVVSTLYTESSCGLLKTNPSGMDENMMQYVTDNKENLLNTVVEIRCCGLSTDSKGNWSTAHPSVVKLRDDKDTCDSLVSAQEIENAAKALS